MLDTATETRSIIPGMSKLYAKSARKYSGFTFRESVAFGLRPSRQALEEGLPLGWP
jgi:hypothetical protein